MAQLVERAGLDDRALADDAHVVAEPLDLAEDVAREQDRGVLLALGDDDVAEHLLHQRVQARRRFVEQQQLDVGRQRRDERDLLAVALRVRAPLLLGVEVEALDEHRALGLVETAAGTADDVDRLATGEVGPQVDVARHVREPTVQVRSVAPRVATEQLGCTGVGAQQSEQHPDRRRLAGAVRSQEAVDLAGRYVHRQAVERHGGPEALDETRDLYRVGAHSFSLRKSPSAFAGGTSGVPSASR